MPPVTPTSYEAKAVANGIAMLSRSATFQTLVGLATPTLALGRIIESWGGNPARTSSRAQATATNGENFTLAAPFAIVHQSEMTTELAGVASYDYTGTISIRLHLARQSGSEAAPDTFVRGRNVLGNIRAELEALFGSDGCLANGAIRSEGPFLPEETGAEGDDLTAELFIDWFA